MVDFEANFPPGFHRVDFHRVSEGGCIWPDIALSHYFFCTDEDDAIYNSCILLSVSGLSRVIVYDLFFTSECALASSDWLVLHSRTTTESFLAPRGGESVPVWPRLHHHHFDWLAWNRTINGRISIVQVLRQPFGNFSINGRDDRERREQMSE